MHNNQSEISVVIPVYNSSITISTLVLKIEQAMRNLQLNYEIIFVDDASTDNSWKVISALCNEKQKIKAILLTKNSGQWVASLAGMSISSGQYIVTIDDDLEYDPEDIAKLYNRITTNPYKVVFGLAQEKYPKQGKVKQLAIWRNRIINHLWNKPITDSFKILNRDVVFKDTTFLPDRLFEAFITHHLPQNYWGYCDVNFSKRIYGESNHSFMKKVKLFWEFSFHFFRFPMKPYVILIMLALLTFILSFSMLNRSVNCVSFLTILFGTCVLVLFKLLNLKDRKLLHFNIAHEINVH